MSSLLAALLTFSALVQNMAATAQGNAKYLLDLTVGSVTRSIFEASASVGLWIQWQVLQVLALTRLATSNGTDADSFGAQFGFTRLPGNPSTGQVTFSRYTATITTLIPVGATVITADGQTSFTVNADSTNAAWNAGSNGFNLPSGTSSVTVTVTCSTSGVAGNVSSGAISLLGTAIAGVDTVTNASAYTNGVAAETDAAYKARFPLFLNSLAQGTVTAYDYAIASVSSALTYFINPNYTAGGVYTPGYITVTIDDGSGATPSGTVSNVQAALNAITAIGTTPFVQAASALSASVSMTITTNSSVTHSTVTTAVASAISAYISGLAVGATLPLTRLAQIAYDTNSNVTNVTGVQINSATADLVPTSAQVIRAGTITVS